MRTLLFITALALQPATGSLRITVTDPSGAVIVGASIQLVAADGVVTTGSSDGTGVATFDAVTPGRYAVRVESAGFEPTAHANVRVRAGQQRRTVSLALAKVAQSITVDRDPAERASDPRGDAFTTILLPHQIEQLPDDPDEMARVLLDMAGPGASIRVNGFRSSRLPPKDQIQQLRFRRNAFAADTHEAGGVFVDVITRPGGETWRGTTGAGFRDSALNARNALAVRKEDESLQRYSLSMNGPLWKQRTSAAISIDATSAIDARTLLALLPSGPVADLGSRALRAGTFSGRIEHAISASHVARIELDRSTGRTDRAGVGDFNLPERGYTQANDGHGLRASIVGPAGKAMFNELRFQWLVNTTTFQPESVAPAVLVLNAFNSGGAQVTGARTSRRYELGNDLDIARGHHAMRAGFLFEAIDVHSTVARNTGGTYTFASLDAFRASAPTTYSRNVGDPRVRMTLTQLGWYVQDDFRARRNLTLSGGLRQEFQSSVGRRVWGPRAAATWSPFASGRTTVRAGAGVFFDWFDAQSYEYAQQLDGTHQQIVTAIEPTYPIDEWLPTLTLPPGRVRIAADLAQPRIEQASAGVEQTFNQDLRLSVMWNHRRGSDLLRGVNANAPVGGLRPDPSSGQVIEIASSARSRSTGVSMQATYSPQRPLFISMSYAWARSDNDTDGPTSLPADARNLAAEWGPSPDDVRHRVTALASTRVVGRTRLGLSMRWQSGSPYDITTGYDDNGDTTSNDRPMGVTRNAARGDGQLDISARFAWNIGFITRPSTGGGPTVLQRTRGDGDALSAFGGAIDITKRYNLELYVQAYNLLNRVMGVSYSGVLTSPLFGQPIAVAPPRRLELGARLRF